MSEVSQVSQPQPRFISAKAFGELIGVSHITLCQWRLRGKGPRYVKCGRTVRYALADVEAWIAAGTVETRAASEVKP